MATELQSPAAKYAQLEQVIAEYKDQPGALIPVLHRAQEIFGYISDEVQEVVSDGLNIALTEVYGVITFYSLFSTKPKGRYTLGLCMGTACYVKGAALVLEELEKQLQIKVNDTSADGLFSLELTRCVGACGLAPVLTVGEDVYGRITADKVKEILAKYQSDA